MTSRLFNWICICICFWNANQQPATTLPQWGVGWVGRQGRRARTGKRTEQRAAKHESVSGLSSRARGFANPRRRRRRSRVRRPVHAQPVPPRLRALGRRPRMAARRSLYRAGHARLDRAYVAPSQRRRRRARPQLLAFRERARQRVRDRGAVSPRRRSCGLPGARARAGARREHGGRRSAWRS